MHWRMVFKEGFRMSEKKLTGRKIVVALGIACIILVAGLVGTAAANYRPRMGEDKIISSLISQISDLRNQIASIKAQINGIQSWTEGTFNFTLAHGKNTKFTISTGGFRSVTIAISSFYNYTPTVYRVFIGFITVNETLNYQEYTVQAFCPAFPSHPGPGANLPPWWWTRYWAGATNFTQTYNVSFSKITVWIWDNSTTSGIFGNVYYYLTK
jgi:hypothetical protein